MDATDEFMAIHSETAKAMMPGYHIGTLSAAAKKSLLDGENVTADAPSEPRPSFLQSKVWTKAVLSAKQKVSWDTRIFTFSLEHESQALGLPTGQHLMMRLRDPVTREAIIRSYTPISEINDKGKVEVLVKVYFDNKDTGVKGGKMSQALDALPVGHGIDFKGPIGKFEYLGKGRCLVKGAERTVKRFLMVCGGSGVTPVFQVFRAVMQDAEDSTTCVMLNGNRLEEDILCREQLEHFEKMGNGRGKVVHTLTKPDEKWQGLKGRVDGELVKTHCPKMVVGHADGDTMVLVCGPEPMEKSIHKALLADGWRDDDFLFF